MSINDIQKEIIDEFSMFEDWEERYQYMIDLGKDLPLIEEQYKTDFNIIKGCQSKVWVHAELKDDKIFWITFNQLCVQDFAREVETIKE